MPHLAGDAWSLSSVPVHFDWQVFTFTPAVTVLTAVLFGLAPAFGASRGDVTLGLKEDAQTTTRRRKGAAGKAVAGFQIALSTLLVIGAGLFIRSLAGLNAVDPGFRSGNLLLAKIPLPQNRYPAGADIAFHQRLEQAISAIPGVESVSPAMQSYLSDDSSDTDFLPEGEASDPNKRQTEGVQLSRHTLLRYHGHSNCCWTCIRGGRYGGLAENRNHQSKPRESSIPQSEPDRQEILGRPVWKPGRHINQRPDRNCWGLR